MNHPEVKGKVPMFLFFRDSLHESQAHAVGDPVFLIGWLQDSCEEPKEPRHPPSKTINKMVDLWTCGEVGFSGQKMVDLYPDLMCSTTLSFL